MISHSYFISPGSWLTADRRGIRRLREALGSRRFKFCLVDVTFCHDLPRVSSTGLWAGKDVRQMGRLRTYPNQLSPIFKGQTQLPALKKDRWGEGEGGENMNEYVS